MQVEIRRKGVYRTATFATKGEARAWAEATEAEITTRRGVGLNRPFARALERYSEFVSPTKRGCRWEQLRIAAMLRDPISSRPMTELAAADFAGFRDRRLAIVSPGTLLREWNLLRNVVNTARDEWNWIVGYPTKGVRLPAKPAHRERIPTDEEMERIFHALGYEPGSVARTATARAAVAWLFACETGMRAGEICGLTKRSITGTVAILGQTKNGTVRRIPLSQQARSLWSVGWAGAGLGLEPRMLDALWRKGVKRSGVVDLHFHDSRHVAITRLAKKLNVLELARMVGHKDIRQLMTYYNESAEETAKKL